MNNTSAYPSVPSITFDQAIPCIQSGDILLVSGNSTIDTLIKSGTNSVWSHVGILFNLDNSNLKRIMMMESILTVGVRSVPLNSYIKNYNGSGKPFNGKIMVARYSGFPTNRIHDIAAKAVDLLGYPYNTDDIADIAARIALNDSTGIKLSSQVGSNKAYICSEYVDVCYQAAGINIPYNPAGYIAPSDFALCDAIAPLFFIQTGTS